MRLHLFDPITGAPRTPEAIRADPAFVPLDGFITDPIPSRRPHFVMVDGIWWCCTHSLTLDAKREGMGLTWREAWADFQLSDWHVAYAAAV